MIFCDKQQEFFLDPLPVPLHRLETIKAHASDIESRQDDSSCTVERLKAENLAFAEGFQKSGETIVWIDQDFESDTK